jgi:hypothetical protein
VPRPDINIPVRCAFCGSTALLTVAGWPSDLQPGVLEAEDVPKRFQRRWTCPVCRIIGVVGVLGRITAVRAVHVR